MQAAGVGIRDANTYNYAAMGRQHLAVLLEVVCYRLAATLRGTIGGPPLQQDAQAAGHGVTNMLVWSCGNAAQMMSHIMQHKVQNDTGQ